MVDALHHRVDMTLRPMRHDDLAAVHAVECAAYPHPWSLEMLADCLRVDYCCWVGEIEHTLIGYGIMSVAVGECHIFNLCIAPHWQHRGLGRALLQHLLRLARQRKAGTAFLEVRASNHRARALYATESFCEIGLRRQYYPAAKGREDAMVLARELIPLDLKW